MATAQARNVIQPQINASTPEPQRSPVAPTESALSDGPIIGENGAFAPASYKTTKGNIRTDR